MPLAPFTRFPGGISNSPEGNPLEKVNFTDPHAWVVSAAEFAGDGSGLVTAASGLAAAHATSPWVATVTEAGGGDASLDYLDEAGGIIRITNDAADDDAVFFQHRSEAYKWASSKGLVIKGRIRVSDATQSDLIFGLSITDTTPLDSSDAFVFQKADGSTTLNFIARKNSSASTTAVLTMADATFYTLVAVYVGPESSAAGAVVYPFFIYVNGTPVARIEVPVANICDDEELAITFGIQNGEAVAKTFDIDTWLFAREK